MIQIRPAILQDLSAIVAIYNQAILRTTATFDTEVKTVEQQMLWFEAHSEKYPLLVAEIDTQTVGWVSLTAWSDRCAYADTAEISFYVDEANRGQGIGKELLFAILGAAKQACLHTVLARIVEGNAISVALHKSAGFDMVGTMREVGWKFGKRLNVVLMQKILNP